MRHYNSKATIATDLTGNLSVKYNNKPFEVFKSLLYSGMPKINMPEMVIKYVNDLFAPGHDRVEPDLVTLRAVAPTLSGLVCLDIEHWPWLNATLEQKQETVRKMVLVIKTIKEVNPNVELGYYSTLPYRSYWVPVNNNPTEMAAWRADNLLFAPVAEVVDCIFPSLYTFYADVPQWIKYAKGNIVEAKIYGKPVMPVLWPQYHNSSVLRYQPIPAAYWRSQLDTCKSDADGVVIWGGYNSVWNPQEGWYLETGRFLLDGI